MMIRKWPLDELDSVRGEQAEKASGMADAGDGVYALAAKFLERSADACASEGSCRKRCDRSDRPGRKAHLEKPLCMHPCRLGREPLAGQAVADERIRAREMARALPQRPGRQQPTIAQPALAIDDDDFEVARQSKMLQAIIAEDQACTPVRSARAAATRSAPTKTGNRCDAAAAAASSPTRASPHPA